jgi:hypothetical protein
MAKIGDSIEDMTFFSSTIRIPIIVNTIKYKCPKLGLEVKFNVWT